MASALSVSAARAQRWTEVLEMLDAVEAIYGDEPLDDAAWQSLRPLVDALDETLPDDAGAVREAASRAIAAAAQQRRPERPEREYGLWGGPGPAPAAGPAVDPAPAVAADDAEPAVQGPQTEDVPQEAAAVQPVPRAAPSRADGSDMRWSDVAHAVLMRTGRPMTAKQIHAESVANGPTRPTSAKTPERTINRDLNQAIKSGDGRFARGPDRGTFVAVADDA